MEAKAQVTAAWSDGNEVPPWKKMFWKLRGKGALAAGDALQSVINADSIDHSLGGQHAGLARALVMSDAPPEVGSASQSHCRSHTGVGGQVQRMLMV